MSVCSFWYLLFEENYARTKCPYVAQDTRDVSEPRYGDPTHLHEVRWNFNAIFTCSLGAPSSPDPSAAPSRPLKSLNSPYSQPFEDCFSSNVLVAHVLLRVLVTLHSQLENTRSILSAAILLWQEIRGSNCTHCHRIPIGRVNDF